MVAISTLAEEVRKNLLGFERREVPPEGRRVAAVAIAIVTDPVESILLTRRPLDAPRHPGQFALPGGMREGEERSDETARRELAEELGVLVPPEAVLGTLDDYATRSGFVITPVVLWCGPTPELTPDPREIAATYRVPLASIVAEDVAEVHEGEDRERPILALQIVDTRVFAPTAAMILQFREVALLGRTTRVAHYGEPRFAWR